MKRMKWALGLSLVGVLAVSGTAYAFNSGTSTSAIGQTPGFIRTAQNQGNVSQAGYGMMGSLGSSNGAPGYSGYGGGCGGANNGSGYGMMGGGYNAASLGVNLTNGQVTTDDQALAIAKAYVQVLNQDLSIDEIHEFNDSYEVELNESKTDNKAFEFLIYKNGGYISSEMGPNVMWNTQYGHMNGGNSGNPGNPTVTAEQATKTAQDFVNQQMGIGYSIEQPEVAPGYYEFMILKEGKDYAELDINGYTGQVWFESWHGPIIKSINNGGTTK
ncbi:PepSY domain-containing protein [Desulfitobacterium sp.]|uniref:PepSY domain-containing protein n=1 Tax=Desulfitobacterium sp. TaxID=49981 RepID=UPI002CFE27A1|nr:PepSY domain-containing protein [Desulfitobacterium sp.]HVJ47695.1 PepSY domain-containing protein [Desulfitobacterium sp.]